MCPEWTLDHEIAQEEERVAVKGTMDHADQDGEETDDVRVVRRLGGTL